jgi:hypothetical protein
LDSIDPPEPPRTNPYSEYGSGYNHGADNMRNFIIQRMLDAAVEAEGNA